MQANNPYNALQENCTLELILPLRLSPTASTPQSVTLVSGKPEDSILTLDLDPQFPPSRRSWTMSSSIASVRNAIDGTRKRRLKYPEEYQKWYDSHKAHCYKNFRGSSQSMEPEAAMTIWKRSTENRQLCYTTFIGDGDSKSYQQISKINLTDPF